MRARLAARAGRRRDAAGSADGAARNSCSSWRQRRSVKKNARVDLFDAARAGEGLRALADQHDVRRMLHHGARKLDGMADVGEIGDGAGGAGAAVHDRSVEMVEAVCAEDSAAPGIEERIVLHFADHGLQPHRAMSRRDQECRRRSAARGSWRRDTAPPVVGSCWRAR